MRLIADQIKLKRDFASKQVVDLLQNEFVNDSVFVYYQYPIFRGDLPEDLIQAQLLVTSPDFGVVYISCKIGEVIDDGYYDYLASLDSNLYKKFISRPELRKSKRELKFDISGIVLTTETKEERETQFSTLGDLIALIKSHSHGSSLTKDEYELMVSCIDNTTKMITKKLRPI